jgi:hypothetical protein
VNERDLDARLRAIFADADTAPGFEAQVMARIAAQHAPDAKLLVLAERRREATRKRLRWEAWTNSATAAGVGIALIALVWREGPLVARWMDQALAAASDFGSLSSLAFLALGLGVWAATQRFLPR